MRTDSGSTKINASATLVSAAAIGASGAAFALIAFMYVVSYWPDVPYFDEWKNVPFAVRVASGSWSLTDLLAPEQGHTVALFRLGTIIETAMLSYDTRFNIGAGYAFLVASALLLVWRYIGFCIAYPKTVAIGLVAMFGLIFSLQNWENLLAAWLVNSAGSLFFMLAALSLIGHRSKLVFFVGFGCALLCSLAFTNGLLIWPASILVLLAAGGRKRFVPIVGAMIILWIRFLVQREGLGGEADIGQAVLRFFALLGLPLSFDAAAITSSGPVSSQLRSGVAGGMVMIVPLMVFISSRRSPRTYMVPIAVSLYGLGSCALIALGRSDLPVEQAMSSRYFTTAAIVYIGLFMLLVEASELRIARGTTALLGLLVVSSTLYANAVEHSTGPYRAAFYDSWRDTVLRYQDASDAELANPHFTPDEIRTYSRELDEWDLGPFRPAD